MTQKYITKEGLQKLQDELLYLKDAKRKEVAERLRRAISFGDLSENFEYSSAKDEQAMVEQKIAEVEETIANAQIVASSGQKDTVQLGSRATLQSGDLTVAFLITDSQSANPLEKKISMESPLGSALIGKKKGEEVRIDTPKGTVSYKIVEIQ
ncbi:MAG: transcription elongation factor GreA [Candidatus Wildermuthbacteria bacterium]|nr:transcription elongation factor GreA [Candidatus Wildermuthbacteria bacterium]